METILLVMYLLGYMLAVGWQYQAIEFYNPKEGVLNKAVGSILLGILSWIVIGVAIHNFVHNSKKDKNGKNI